MTTMNPYIETALNNIPVIIITVILTLILNIIFIVFVYKDSRKRQIGSGIDWIMILIITSWLGLATYLLVRRGHPIKEESEISSLDQQ